MLTFYKQLYLCLNDLSVSVISPQVSIVARQQDGRLSHYHSRSGNSLELLYPGEMSAEVSQQHGIFLMSRGFPLFEYILVSLQPKTGQ